MTKGAAIHSFLNTVMTAYAETAVPTNATFPYLTYELNLDSVGGGEVPLTVNMYFYSESEATPNAKAQELSAAVGYGGKVLPCDGGYVWLKRGHPFSQALSDPANPKIKRRYINISAEFLTLN